MGNYTNRFFYIATAVVALASMSSCGTYNMLFPKKQNNYIDYRQLFSDASGSTATKNRTQLIDPNEGKVRIITINKITNDTIVEWVDPITITNGRKLVVKAAEPKKEVDTVLTPVTTEAEIVAPHKAVIFSRSEAGTSFMKRNDTLFVSASEKKMQSVLLALVGSEDEDTQIVIDTSLSNSTNADAGNKKNKGDKKGKLFAKLRKNSKGNAEASEIKKDVGSTTAAAPKPKLMASLDKNAIVSNNSLLVGDLNFDTDPTAVALTNADELNEVIQKNFLQWRTFKCKAKVKLKTTDDNKTFNANFRMQQQTHTWASIHVPVVGELFRAHATPDSIAFLNKWKDKYMFYTTDQMQELLSMPIPYTAIQDYIIGNPPITSGTQIFGKKSTKGYAIKIIQPGLSCVLSYNANKTLRSVVMVGNSNGKSYSVKHTLTGYVSTPVGMLSTARNIVAVENGKETNIQLELSKPEFEQEVDFPFTVPPHFKNGREEK